MRGLGEREGVSVREEGGRGLGNREGGRVRGLGKREGESVREEGVRGLGKREGERVRVWMVTGLVCFIFNINNYTVWFSVFFSA